MMLKDIASQIGLECDDGSIITGINTLKDANENELSFLENPKYIEDLKNTKAKAVLIHPKNAEFLPDGVVGLLSDEPYLKLALATKLYARPPFEKGEPKSVADSCVIMPNVYIGKDAVIGENVTLMSGVYVGDGAVVGDGTLIYPSVTVYRDCVIGKNCVIHANTVVGSDGFGFAHTKQGEHVKIYQNGNVVIEDDVEIGANTAIDRAVFGTTIIKAGSKIDNLVQVGHNCEIGERAIICGQTGLAGSSVLGRNVVMGAQSGSAGHLKIGDFATIAARGGVTKTIAGGKIYAGFPLVEHREWLKQQANIAKLSKKNG